MCLNAGVQKLNVSKEPETPLCLWSAAEIFALQNPELSPPVPHLILLKSHFFTSVSTFGVCWEFCTLLEARMKHFHFAKIFFVFFRRFLWPASRWDDFSSHTSPCNSQS